MIIRRHLFVFLMAGIFLPVMCPAQSDVDSLRQLVNTLPADSTRVKALVELASKTIGTSPDEAIRIAGEARDLAIRIHDKKGQATALKYLGLGYSGQNQYMEATLNWQEALRIFEDINDQDGIANILSNLGTIYSNQGDDEKALELYLRALTIAEESNDKMRILTVSLNIGQIYQKKPNNHNKALDYLLRSLSLSEEMDYSLGIGYSTVNLGEIYMARDEDSTALNYFEISRKALEGTSALPYVMIDIGKVYAKQGDFEKALEVQREAYAIAEDLNSKLFMAQSLLGMAHSYVEQNLIDKAIETFQKAEPLALEIGSKESLREAYAGLASYSAELNDYESAYYYQKLLTAVKDSLFQSANENRLNLMMSNFNLEKKEKELEVQELTLQKQRVIKNGSIAGLILILIIAFIILRNYLAKARINRILDQQNEEIEALLKNILPESVAQELQKTGRATPRDYDSVSVLFTDFKGFSSIASNLDPSVLVNELSSFFIAFDSIIDKYHLEKIKTIGDAYMCAGGIPTSNDTHPEDAVRAGLEMQEFITSHNQQRISEGKIPWDLRVGIHTGPVVAGVVGKKKYAYDIWGSTVNIASRMESNGEAGKVNISQATYQLVQEKFDCEYRGKISAKNVGEVDMYFVSLKN